MEEQRVEVDERALAQLQARLSELGSRKVAIISVMGAFRTGKSFLLDVFLRYLRYEDAEEAEPEPAAGPMSSPSHASRCSRAGAGSSPAHGAVSGAPYEPPAWLTRSGQAIGEAEGFRFTGGMDHCTEGIWIWSEPFVRMVRGQEVAVLLIDTQGAWDPLMTEEQSATIFGLTSLLSSKQIYNISMQIQRDKVENLAYFVRFAQATLRSVAAASPEHTLEDVERPFQSLDFLVRDWPNFEDGWTMAQCKEQMHEHLDRFLNPRRQAEGSTAEALYRMFGRIGCFCLPHPGLHIQRSTWSGRISEINPMFLRFLEEYVREVFEDGLEAKTILGSELTTITFPHVFRHFVAAFRDAAPAAMSFSQAIATATILLAQEQAMTSYSQRMDQAFARNPEGLESAAFEALHATIAAEVENQFSRVPILGAAETRQEAWSSIQRALKEAFKRYVEENTRRLDRVLVRFANAVLLASSLFFLDRVSDFACDWWSQACCDFSRLLLIAYTLIFSYVAWHVKRLMDSRRWSNLGNASAELCKEIVRLVGVYGDLVCRLEPSNAAAALGRPFAAVAVGSSPAARLGAFRIRLGAAAAAGERPPPPPAPSRAPGARSSPVPGR